jgi:hypothetical protein
MQKGQERLTTSPGRHIAEGHTRVWQDEWEAAMGLCQALNLF